LSLSVRPHSTVLVEDGHAMLMLFPPAPGVDAGLGLPTETLFVIDVSGSMAGPSIDQARLALLAALDRLRPDDRFNLLKFNGENEAFRPGFAQADQTALDAARRWVGGLEAGGGTEILPALVRGLELLGDSTSTARVQRLVFLTDGAVADTDDLLRLVASGLGRTRLHTLGIGPAPNRYLMRKMARFGRGLCSFVATRGEAGNRIDAFFERLDRPVMTDLTLEWEALAAEDTYPRELPDLHAGQPLVLYGRVTGETAEGRVRLTGLTRVGWIEAEAEATAAPDGAGIATRWGQARVEALMDSLYEGADPDAVRSEVIEVALSLDLVTAYTSLVAVEQTVTALGPAGPVRTAGALPRGGTDGRLRLLVGLVLFGSGLALAAWRGY